ncbi:MAG: hypothetical protein Q8Q60_00650 [Candidatus Chromulinivorax sp.]|nr:hypothetical protein [Candidatus Chromulinivorax sp.]
MNKKLQGLLFCAMIFNVQLYPSESGLKTIAASLIAGSVNFAGGIAVQCFRAIGMLDVAPQSLGNLTGESAFAAAVTAVYVAPVFYGWGVDFHEYKLERRRHVHQHGIEHFLTHTLHRLHEDGKVKSEWDNSCYQLLCSDQWQLQRFNELCKKESLSESNTEEFALACSPTVLSPASFGLLCCDCPKMAVATLAASYGAVGLAKLSEKIEKEKLRRITEQIDKEIYPSEQAKYKTDEEFLTRIDNMIVDTYRKNEEAQVDTLKCSAQRQTAREKIAREVCDLYNK